MALEFHECDTCAAKPGTPPLCDGCISNRNVITVLRECAKAAYGSLDAAEKAIEPWVKELQKRQW
jgi:hypothetical protein